MFPVLPGVQKKKSIRLPQAPSQVLVKNDAPTTQSANLSS